MSNRDSQVSAGLVLAAGFVLLLWTGYATLQTLFFVQLVSEAGSAPLGLVPGVLGVTSLLAAGLPRSDCSPQFAPLSRRGWAVLGAIFLFALAAFIPVGEWQSWNGTAALLYAPVSGASQELFFRLALLPAIQQLLGPRLGPVLVVHSLLFGLWHIGSLFLGAPAWALLGLMLVSFVCGIGWGWQVHRDRTVVWAVVQHSLIWAIGLQFPVSGQEDPTLNPIGLPAGGTHEHLDTGHSRSGSERPMLEPLNRWSNRGPLS